MKVLNLKQAASLLNMSTEGLRRLTSEGRIPAAKVGGRWVFIEDDVADYLRSLYASSTKAPQGVVRTDRRTTTWHSAKEAKFGGSGLATMEDEYNKVLGLATS